MKNIREIEKQKLKLERKLLVHHALIKIDKKHDSRTLTNNEQDNN